MTTTDTTLTPIDFADVKAGDRIRIEYLDGSLAEFVVQTRDNHWLDCSFASFPYCAGVKLYLLDRPDGEATLRAKRARLAYWEACGEPRHSEPREGSLNAWKAALEAADDADANTRPTPKPKVEPKVEVGDLIRITRRSADGFYARALQVGMVGAVTDAHASSDGYWAIQDVNFHPVKCGRGDLIQSIRPGDFEIVTWKQDR